MYLTGVCVVVLHEDKVLISKRLSGAADGVGLWACPGGSLEPEDQGVVAGAARELLEETGLTLVDGHLTNFVEEGVRKGDGRTYATLFVVGTAADVGVLKNPEPHKHEDWQWVATTSLPETMWSRAIVERIAKGGLWCHVTSNVDLTQMEVGRAYMLDEIPGFSVRDKTVASTYMHLPTGERYSDVQDIPSTYMLGDIRVLFWRVV